MYVFKFLTSILKLLRRDISVTVVESLVDGLWDSLYYSILFNILQVPVPALKDQIATVTGVLSEQQRLICRGKVLKDDQLLSAYRILFSFFGSLTLGSDFIYKL